MGRTQTPSSKRERTELRLDSGWGSEPIITWLLERGYQVTGKFRSAGRVRKLVRGISTWHPTSSPGREVAEVPTPVAFVRPLAQYAVRTPSKEDKDGYSHAVVFTSRTDLTMTGVVEHDGVVRVRLRRQHPRARDVCQGFLPLFLQRQSIVVVG